MATGATTLSRPCSPQQANTIALALRSRRRQAQLVTMGVFDMGQFSGSSSPHAGSRCLISFHCSSTRLQRTKKPSLSWLPCNALDFRFSGAKRVPCSREPRVRIALPPLSPTAPLEHGTSTPPRRRARRHRRSPGRRARRRSQRRELGSRAAVDWGSA